MLPLAAAAMAMCLVGCVSQRPGETTPAFQGLRATLEKQMELMQPEDWLLIAPEENVVQATAHLAPQQLVLDAGSPTVLREVLDLLESEGKLEAQLLVSRESTQSFTPGSARYRRHLRNLLSGRYHRQVDERVIAAQLRSCAPGCHVLILRTNTTQPHSTIALRLTQPVTHEPPPLPMGGLDTYQHADAQP